MEKRKFKIIILGILIILIISIVGFAWKQKRDSETGYSCEIISPTENPNYTCSYVKGGGICISKKFTSSVIPNITETCACLDTGGCICDMEFERNEK